RTVTIVLQGFLGKSSLTALGNWRGKERDTPSAIQFMELEAGGCEVPFRAQQDTIRNLCTVITMRTGTDINVDGFVQGSKIFLRRRVFTKVRPTDRGVQSVQLDDHKDPYGAARKIASRWRIEQEVLTAIRRPSGSKIAVAPTLLTKGDFVEVTASARIETVRTRKRNGTIVSFEMHEVVRLYNA
ncbi:hypothetical protein C2E23DRAFT_693745, partial [Lenzites betulinus]